MGLFLRAGADFVTAVTGLASQEWLLAIMTVLMVLVLLYTTLGGMVSIIITDLVQFIVLSFGLIIVSYFAINHIGWDNIVNSITERPDAPPLNPFAEGSGYGVMYFISMILLWVSVMALWQSGTLRALSARDPKTAKRIYFFASIGYVARFIIPAFWGVCAVAFLAMPENADIAARIAEDPAGAEGMLKPIQAMPVMLGHVVPSVLLGIVVAAMLAAFMSTHDSYLLCWAGVLTQDVVAPLFGDRISDKQRIWFTRAFIVAQGIFLLIWGLWYPAPASLWDYMATTGTVYLSGASAVVVCGLYWKRASNAGAMGALLFGLLALVPVFADSLPAGWLEEGTWTYKIFKQSDVTRVFAFAGSWVAMILFSLLIPNRGRTTSGQAE
jgi:SSS family solute:Na+ symporter